MKKAISIGIQGFSALREQDCFFVDKTNFIKEWWESEDEVTLITRPRRFGKTLNMSMLNCFFSNKYADRGELFEKLEIWKDEKYRELQGTYPVIFLSFAEIKQNNYQDTIAKIKKILISNPKIAELSRIFTYAHNFLYLGRGYSFPVALEGALKLKEISYIHAEGYPAAEMKHGPIALIDAEMPVVVVATHNAMYEKIMSNIQEIKARKGKVIALVTEGDTVISKLADDCIELPETLECLEPLIATVPLQLLAYHVAICKGKNVDQPRNLAKSVTVE